jgi:DNA topoisomerase VI subunit A
VGTILAGPLIVIDRSSATGEPIEIDCANLGSGAYSILRSVEHLGFRTDAKFVLAIETGGMFQRLWIAAIKQLLKMGVRAEQQALAKWSLN